MNFKDKPESEHSEDPDCIGDMKLYKTVNMDLCGLKYKL
jgi:hypothetical protein